MNNLKCERCGETLTEKTAIWLELNRLDGTYHKAGEVPETESQGWFAFGRSCAKKATR